MPRIIESLWIDGPAGRLEAMLEEPEGEPARMAAVVCHPHPLYGGTMHNKVVHRIARGLRRCGIAVLRFNFRGVGRSQGAHGYLDGEIEDARAALKFVRGRFPSLPFALAGFSFGARAITRLGCEAGDARFLLAAGFPVRFGPADYLRECRTPKIVIQSTRDEFGQRPDIEHLFETFAEPKSLVWIDAPDHFFTGSLDPFEHAVFESARAQL